MSNEGIKTRWQYKVICLYDNIGCDNKALTLSVKPRRDDKAKAFIYIDFEKK